MNNSSNWLGAIALVASVASASIHTSDAAPLRTKAASPCAADSNFQRLAFWVGDWDVFDSTGARYATQRVRSVIDACAITAEWTGPVGDKGMSLSSFDVRTHEWKQLYASNQVPAPFSVKVRNSDPSYNGPGIRFTPQVDSASGGLSRTRITIEPLSGHRAAQRFEDSHDGGKTWQLVFTAEHRLRETALP